MDALVKNRTTIAVGLLVIALFLGYKTFFSGGSAVPEDPNSIPASALGADLLKMSAEISKASLGQDLFDDPAYTYLSDFSITLPPQTYGRSNPFNQIGR